jgi:hypothetical protein
MRRFVVSLSVVSLSIIVLFTLTACQNEKEKERDPVSPSFKLIWNETVQYPENEAPFIKVKREDQWQEISTIDDYPSKPNINLDQVSMVFVSPYEFELAGDAWIYNIEKNEKKQIFTHQQAGEQKSVKNVLWFNDEHVLILTGNTYGTVPSCRTLYLLNVNNDKIEQIVQLESNQNLREIEVKDETSITFTVDTYDDEMLNFTSAKETVKMDAFLKAVKGGE